jgi:hypothetical protein
LFALVASFFNGVSIPELLVNYSILVLLIFFSYVSWRKSIQQVHVVFGILISFLLALNFLQYGGSVGYSKFNYYAGLYIISMVYSGRKLFISIAFHLTLLVVVILIDYMNHPIAAVIYVRSSFQTIDFWFTLIVISLFAYHLKRLTDIYSQRLSSMNIDMANRVRQARGLSKRLQEKNAELRVAQQHLESEVSRRSEVYNSKSQSIEKFLKVNTSDLVEPVQELVSLSAEIQGASPLMPLLRQSVINLEKVSASIRQAILSDQPVNRNNINRS